MPSKYVVRNLRGNSYYHVYNRGVENRDIFLDRQDYETFLFYLYIYTAVPEEIQVKYPNLPPRLKIKNLSGDINLAAYCLMPNHFHLLVKQGSTNSMPRLLKQITNGYTTYFNSKYQRKGKLMHGRYKSVPIESEYLFVQMVRFIHLNPSIAGLCRDPGDYSWSSYKNPLHTNELMNRFGSTEEWEKFHLDQNSYQSNLPKIRDLTISE
ncbi:MAG: transposase [bacterium]|nr:transposase [bacterium]